MNTATVLCILDGVGLRAETQHNAVAAARMDNINALPVVAKVWTHGTAVGLPEGQMGNSEVGHMNIGAGKIALPEFGKIDAGLADGSLARAPAFVALKEALQNSRGRCHVLGILSPGGVHGHMDQLLGWVKLLHEAGISSVVHAFSDGRDTPPRSADAYLADFAARLPVSACIGTLSGRYYAMDRDQRHERTQRAYDALVTGDAPRFADAHQALSAAYAQNIGDEFVPPCVLGNYAGVQSGDGLLMTNFRADRARQLLTALTAPEDGTFNDFPRARVPHWSACAGAVRYSLALDAHVPPIVPPSIIPDTLGERVAAAGLAQIRIAETEKYAHVTFFFSGGREAPFDKEDRVLVPSPKVTTYDLAPAMSADAVSDAVVQALQSHRYALIVVNYANGDMVGHTGDFAAAVHALEAVDAAIGRVLHAAREAGACVFITADHGNAEEMLDAQGRPHTQHTLHPVPLRVADFSGGGALSLPEQLRLCDLASLIAQKIGGV